MVKMTNIYNSVQSIFSNNGSNPNYIAEFVILIVILATISTLFALFFQKKTVRITVPIMSILSLIFYIFKLDAIYYTSIIIMTSFIIMVAISNTAIVMPYLSNKKRTVRKSASSVTDEFINKLISTLTYLSEKKCGAIIVLEGEVSILDKATDKWVDLNSSFVPELVKSIFYVGTPLHDGAMVIKDTKIIASKVVLPLSKSSLSGTYGTRHRAALGISEATDSITLVVSEETGKISAAYNGTLTTLSRSEFKNYIYNLLKDTKVFNLNKTNQN